MIKKILNKYQILEKGLEFENLFYGFPEFGDAMLEDQESGKLFSGITYELYENEEIMYYCKYLDGFAEGDFVNFYENGNLKSISKMKKGQVYKEFVWYLNGNPKLFAKYIDGVCVAEQEWDEKANLLYKKNITNEDINDIEDFKDIAKNWIMLKK